MKIVFIALLIIHLLIHFIGFFKAFDLVKLPESSNAISITQGIFWLFTALLFIPSVIFYIQSNPVWAVIAIPAAIVSQVLIVLNWNDAKFGTIVNLLIILIAIIHFAGWEFERSFQKEVSERIENYPADTLTQQDLAGLPEVVKNYLLFVGVVGKPKVKNIKISFEGEMREKDKEWFKFRSEQFNFTDSPARFFFMKANFKGLPTRGFHSFKSSGARMQIKPLSLFSVVDLSPPELFPTEMVTYLNDICLFAPAALIDKRIEWEELDDLSVKAIFKLNNEKVSAVLEFNEEGELANFISEDRYAIDIMKKLRFSTPVKNYRHIRGYRLPSYGEAIWCYPEGEFTYGRFNLTDVQYNITKLNKT
ncbi:DUF6544 family protein [Christiangramia crocea]|uniref:Uncharacterized protein n=1 Tax=Christiangramia crocea TaxID=2904124 RepID=A0A9X2A7V3_9FLAO|nr:DUF6544 family protein [Gramella crocea]MCG9971912.1 hypothetical protein [Gramella crocea]